MIWRDARRDGLFLAFEDWRINATGGGTPTVGWRSGWLPKS